MKKIIALLVVAVLVLSFPVSANFLDKITSSFLGFGDSCVPACNEPEEICKKGSCFPNPDYVDCEEVCGAWVYNGNCGSCSADNNARPFKRDCGEYNSKCQTTKCVYSNSCAPPTGPTGGFDEDTMEKTSGFCECPVDECYILKGNPIDRCSEGFAQCISATRAFAGCEIINVAPVVGCQCVCLKNNEPCNRDKDCCSGSCVNGRCGGVKCPEEKVQAFECVNSRKSIAEPKLTLKCCSEGDCWTGEDCASHSDCNRCENPLPITGGGLGVRMPGFKQDPYCYDEDYSGRYVCMKFGWYNDPNYADFVKVKIY